MIQSDLPLASRKNIGCAIFGGTGTGKTRMARSLAKSWHRVVTADPTRSVNDGEICRDYAHFSKRFSEVYPTNKPFRLCAQFYEEDDWRRFWLGLWTVFRRAQTPSRGLLLNIDEVDFWSDPNSIDPSLKELFRYGRHIGMSWLVTCRADVETHRAVRMNASEILLFRQGMLSVDMKKKYLSADVLRFAESKVKMPAVESLADNDTKADEGIEGTHFVALPDSYEKFRDRWDALAESVRGE